MRRQLILSLIINYFWSGNDIIKFQLYIELIKSTIVIPFLIAVLIKIRVVVDTLESSVA